MRDDEERAFEEFLERTAQRLLRCAVRVFGGEAVRTPAGWKITRGTYCGAVMMICPS
ncbi:hypothetical protein [Frankia sp. AgKG'84/4]|uniref:hypothetical protein n=1 Tax=Frankia sp. AgKG'84/4 TaxID=573490 RepID=UPI00200CF2AB|nr:hypothetical protein [Frankia sp. AgKG'84/4]MCL9796029.1 hypothetical protein [Frankia sp. AgKG'84/4]